MPIGLSDRDVCAGHNICAGRPSTTLAATLITGAPASHWAIDGGAPRDGPHRVTLRNGGAHATIFMTAAVARREGGATGGERPGLKGSRATSGAPHGREAAGRDGAVASAWPRDATVDAVQRSFRVGSSILQLPSCSHCPRTPRPRRRARGHSGPRARHMIFQAPAHPIEAGRLALWHHDRRSHTHQDTMGESDPIHAIRRPHARNPTTSPTFSPPLDHVRCPGRPASEPPHRPSCDTVRIRTLIRTTIPPISTCASPRMSPSASSSCSPAPGRSFVAPARPSGPSCRLPSPAPSDPTNMPSSPHAPSHSSPRACPSAPVLDPQGCARSTSPPYPTSPDVRA